MCCVCWSPLYVFVAWRLCDLCLWPSHSLFPMPLCAPFYLSNPQLWQSFLSMTVSLVIYLLTFASWVTNRLHHISTSNEAVPTSACPRIDETFSALLTGSQCLTRLEKILSHYKNIWTYEGSLRSLGTQHLSISRQAPAVQFLPACPLRASLLD